MTAELIKNLVGAFNQENLRYCHWKSNYNLAESLSGETDFDLLIDRKSLSRILIILIRNGFKSARLKSRQDPDGIFHYYGLDVTTGKLIHVHLFSSILTGESFVKTHLLPFEDMLLENTYYIEAIKVASLPAELVTFVIRTFIKYGSFLDVLELARKTEMLREELAWLQKYCPVLDECLFLELLTALKENASLLKRILLAKTVRKHLHIYAKYHLPGLISAYSQFIWEKVHCMVEKHRKSKSLNTGGVVIAFVGAEATGKSSLVSVTETWLGQIFSTRTIHAGKPPSTWMTAPLNVIVPLLRQVFPLQRTTRQDAKTASLLEIVSPPVTKGWFGLIYAIRSVSLAWDRRHLLVQARNYAANGEIVICDRYPSENIGAMDSPRLQEIHDLKGLKGALYNWLARLEQRYYKEIPPPDMVLKLRVSMEIARQRNRDRIKVGKETDAYLEARHNQCREWCMNGTKFIYEIDTEQSLDNTILLVKRTIWEVI
jgi:thymidylate kinase